MGPRFTGRKQNPKWFNEGLAQCFASQFGPSHVRTYERMLANQTWIPFSSLEGSFSAFADPEDAGMAYHQSLAMVLMMIDSGGTSAIGTAIAVLSDSRPLGPLLEAMFPQASQGKALLAFLARWRDAGWVPRVGCAVDQ